MTNQQREGSWMENFHKKFFDVAGGYIRMRTGIIDGKQFYKNALIKDVQLFIKKTLVEERLEVLKEVEEGVKALKVSRPPEPISPESRLWTAYEEMLDIMIEKNESYAEVLSLITSLKAKK